jgi:polyisoprenoid-binding protein YceI
MLRRALIAAATLAALAGPAAAETVWEIDPAHTSVQFAVSHMMVSTVRGDFSKVAGMVTADEKDLTRSKVHATIDASTIDTREA